MKTITAVLVDGVITSSEPIPENAVRVIYDGVNYTVYEAGDELPPDAVYDQPL